MNIGAAVSRSIKRTYMSAGSRFPELILSGIQPTGSPHIGNFLGVLSKWVSLQQTAHDSVTLLYPIVDLHALTIPRDPEQLKKSKIETAIVLLACGIDPARSLIFEQSRIPAHTELAWFFNCITPMGWLSRMTQWKSKLKLKTNSQFSEHDVLSASASAKRIMSLYDPSKKMSKSDPENTRINMSDPPEIIAEKIKKSTSDSLKYITYDPETRPAIANLVTIYAAVQGITIDQVVVEHGKSNIKTFKDAVTQVLVEKLSPIQEEIQRLRLEQGYVQQVLKNGAEKASIIAENNLDEIRRVVGLK
ncbi:5778_t:CDS:2 [Gigaspora rosea]|nr:5778_t:CDS:2 [Gigaspora rosea]